MRTPIRRSQLLAQPEPQDHHLTAEKLARLKTELERIKKTDRPQTIEQMQLAAQDGDFSENAPYQDAKFRLRRLNARIQTLEDRIKRAIIIEPSTDGFIRVGSTVTLTINDKKIIYQILGSQESDPAHGRISHNAPLGRTLLGKRKGERFTLASQNGVSMEYEIADVC